MNDHEQGKLMRSVLMVALAGLLVIAPAFSTANAAPPVPDTVTWEAGIEYSNPADEHLQLNLAHPKSGTGPFPAILCIHGGGFRAGKRESYDALCIRLAGTVLALWRSPAGRDSRPA